MIRYCGQCGELVHVEIVWENQLYQWIFRDAQTDKLFGVEDAGWM